MLCFIKSNSNPCSFKEESKDSSDSDDDESKDSSSADESDNARAKRMGAIDDMWLLLQYYRILRPPNEIDIMGKSRVTLTTASTWSNYEVVSVQSIEGHAYLAPDFEDERGKTFFWDHYKI